MPTRTAPTIRAPVGFTSSKRDQWPVLKEYSKPPMPVISATSPARPITMARILSVLAFMEIAQPRLVLISEGCICGQRLVLSIDGTRLKCIDVANGCIGGYSGGGLR